MWWYNHESNETIYKLMKEYHLSWHEYFEATQGPTCIIWKKDPVTGQQMFPKHQVLPEEELEKLKRNAIEDYYNHCDFKSMEGVIRKKYNIYGAYFYLIIGNNPSDFDYDAPIEIRKKWCLMIEDYFKKYDKEYSFYESFTLNKVKFTVSDLSVQSLKEKLNLKDEKEAEEHLKSIKKDYLITPNGLRRKEKDDTSYAELFIKPEDKEEIYEQVIDLINKKSLDKISKKYLMKYGFNYNAVSVIMDALIERGYLEESNKIGTFNVLDKN